jgi:DNA uptake protein ComE-like DNA-binding protein
MAKGGQTSGTDAASWLPPGMRGEPSPDAASNGDARNSDASNGDQAGKLEEWLAVPEPGQKRPKPKQETPNGSRAVSTEVEATDLEPSEPELREDELAGSTDEPEPRPLRARRDRGGNPRERWLASRLGRANEKLRAQDEVIEELKARVTSLEAEVKSARRASKPKAAKETPAEKPSPAEKPKPAKPRRAPKPKRGSGLDLNSATFEQLRGLGLSITQSARLIAYRDTRGFESLDDLAAVPGFSRDTLRDLSSQVQL